MQACLSNQVPDLAKLLASALQCCEGYTELGMWEAAWEELEALPSELKTDFGVLTWRMQILVGLNEHQKASFIGLTLVEHHPDKLGVLLLTADCLMTIKDHESAKIILREKIAWHTTQPDAWLALARVEAQLGNSLEVRDAIEQYIALYPEGRVALLDIPELAFLWE